MAKQPKQKKEVQKYKSLYTGRPVTLQQFLVESIYANNGIFDVSRYMAGKKYLLNEYKKNISIVSKSLKRVSSSELFEIIAKNKVKDGEDLVWRVDQREHLNSLKNLPKDNAPKKASKFVCEKDFRDKDFKDKDCLMRDSKNSKNIFNIIE